MNPQTPRQSLINNNHGFTMLAVALSIVLIPTMILVATQQYSVATKTAALQHSTSTKNNLTVIKNWLLANSKDVDNDTYPELVHEGTNNALPLSIPTRINDDWGSPIRYYTWDLGSANVNPVYSQNNTAPPLPNLIGRIISAGKDGIFQTTAASTSAQGDDIVIDIFATDVGASDTSGWKEDTVANTVTLKNTGRFVGIGTSNPLYNLSVQGSVGPANNTRAGGGHGGIDFIDNGIGYANSAKIYTFKDNSDGEYYGLTNDYDGAGAQLSMIAKYTTGNIGFYTGNPAVRRMSITNSGVGIGVSSPLESLHVAGNMRADGFVYSQDNPTYAQTRLHTWGLGGDGTVYIESGGGSSLELTDSWSRTGALNMNFGSVNVQSGSLNVTSGNVNVSGNVNATNFSPGSVFNSGGGSWLLGSSAWGGSGPATNGVNSATGLIYTGGGGSQLLTLSSGPGQTSLQLDGSIFIGDGIGYNPIGVAGSSDGYLVVQNSGSFGGNLYTQGVIYPSNGIGGNLYGDANGIRTSSNFLANGNIYWGTKGVWLDSWLNQAVRTDSSVTFANITNTGNGNFYGHNYFYSNNGWNSYLQNCANPGLMAFSSDGGAAFMSFHRGGYYAVNIGLDPDNAVRIGGWSDGAQSRATFASNGDFYTRAAMFPSNGVGGYIYADGNGIRTSSNLLANGNIYWGMNGIWLDSWLNQPVRTDSSPTFSTVYTNNWFRSNGATGWYNQTYGGGIWMTDTTWVRVYNGKAFRTDSTMSAANISSDGDITLGGNLNFTKANPTISASGYVVIPNGIQSNAVIQANGGLKDTANANLSLYGGTSGNIKIVSNGVGGLNGNNGLIFPDGTTQTTAASSGGGFNIYTFQISGYPSQTMTGEGSIKGNNFTGILWYGSAATGTSVVNCGSDPNCAWTYAYYLYGSSNVYAVGVAVLPITNPIQIW